MPAGKEKGIEAFKKTCDLLGLTCLCSSLFSEPAATRLPLSAGIMRCRADGHRRDSRHIYMCVCVCLPQPVCVGEDGSLKCCVSVRSPAAWEHADHMHGAAGRRAVLTGRRKAIPLCSLGSGSAPLV